MGKVKLHLYKGKLNNRELHNSRLFVDIGENIHVHYREYRFVFSVDEYLEFTNIIENSTKDVRNYLYQNPGYIEQGYKDTLIIAGGKDRQMKLLENSPKPHESKYFNNDFSIELQDEDVTDEIHVHYRDFRLVLKRESFKAFADGIIKARDKLLEFERNNAYIRRKHPDREILEANIKKLDSPFMMGVKSIDIGKIVSPYYEDIIKDWMPEDPDFIQFLKNELKKGKTLAPIIVSQSDSERYTLILGHHRIYAAKRLGLKEISCVVIPYSHKETEKLRKVEVLLKEFDKETKYKHHLSAFYEDYIAFKLNRFYVNSFTKKVSVFNLHRIFLQYVKKILRKMKSIMLQKNR